MGETQEVRVTLKDGMHFVGMPHPPHDDFLVPLDSAEDFGGQGKGARPQSLLLVSLAGCTGMDVISILRKKRQEVTAFEIAVRGVKADEHPKVYTHIWVTYRVTGRDVDPAAVERAIELSLTRYCPVAGLLRQVVPIETAYEIIPA